MSTFALISSVQQRLLHQLPENASQTFNDKGYIIALSLFLQPPVPRDETGIMSERRISMMMLWLWQCPMMLMNYSWVFFLVGYALHLLTPVFDPSQAEISITASQQPFQIHPERLVVNTDTGCHYYCVWLRINCP